jgi:hypothetical protein
MTASQLERVLRAYRRVTSEEASALQEQSYVGWTWDEDGSLLIRGRLAPEDGVLFLKALEAARDALQEQAWEEERGSAEPRASYRPTSAEAFTAMAETALAAVDRGGGRSVERHQVIVHVDAAALACAGEGGCSVEEGPALAPETARRIACDSSLVEVTEQHGEPLSIGRKRRTVPPALHRALRARDHGCRFPGCDNRRFVDAHHVEHWAHGGETTVDNLVLLCRRHHRYVHEGGYSIERRAGGELRFRNRWGGVIESAPRPPPGTHEGLVDASAALEIDEWTYDPGYGDRMDLELALEALVQALR